MNSTNVERIITCPFIAFILTCSLSLDILKAAAIDVDDQVAIFIILYGLGLCLVLLETSEIRQVFNDSTQSHRGVAYYTHLEA